MRSLVAGSTAGITDISLIPTFEYREVVGRLRAALREAECLRAAVAYWCVGVNELGPDLVRSLSGGGFLCVDIHLPTDIDRLCTMAAAGANVYLYLMNPVPQPGELKVRLPPHLMHTKMLLFDSLSEPADLWVGSHNWTARALTGVNIEASLSVRLSQDSELYGNTVDFLDAIRSNCERFDPNAVPYYKWLQGMDAEEEIWVLELRGSRSILTANGKLTVFGRTEEDYKNLKSVDKNIVISLEDDATGAEFLFEAAINDTGRLAGAGVTLDSRLYAQHDGSPRPQLTGPVAPPQTVLSTSSSWATVALVEELMGASFEIPPAQRWMPAEDEPMRKKVIHEFRKWFQNPDKPLVERAVPRSVFEGQASLAGEAAPMLSSQPKLLRKKIVRAKRRSGQQFTLRKGRNGKGEDR
jgi:hypothetical protein